MTRDLSVELFGEKLDNPIIPASGTFGFGYEFADIYDINILGSISLKGTTAEPRYGNPLPRIAECPSGMINAIGLQNPGVDKVLSEELPKLNEVFHKKAILNVGGHSFDEYCTVVKKIGADSRLLAIELNISCPNVKGGGMAFGVNPDVAANLVKAVKAVSGLPIIVKLSPNVTDIVQMALAVEEAGADAVSLINTLVGMRINLNNAKPIISVGKGGYSGRGVFPVAVRMVYDVYSAVKIPVIGMGGVTNAAEVLELMYAGATAVMVGTANLIEPNACKNIIETLPSAMEKYKINSLKEIIGRAHNG